MQLPEIIDNIGKWLRTGKKIKDSMTVGVISGLIGTVVMDIFQYILWRNRKTENLYGHMAGSVLMRAFRTNQTKNFILGQIMHLITGAAIGLIHMEFLKRYGKDNHLFKGSMLGLFSWGILYNVGQKKNFFSRRTHLTKTHYATILNNILYGITTSQAIVWLADPALFKKKEKQESPISSVTAGITNPTYKPSPLSIANTESNILI